jgi:hypothetical protein
LKQAGQEVSGLDPGHFAESSPASFAITRDATASGVSSRLRFDLVIWWRGEAPWKNHVLEPPAFSSDLLRLREKSDSRPESDLKSPRL